MLPPTYISHIANTAYTTEYLALSADFHRDLIIHSQVVLVRWNEPFQKLATCDMEGGIFVWIQYEGRWSVELVNDRGAQVSNNAFITKAVLS